MREQDLSENWKTVLKPMLEQAPIHHFIGKNGVKICYTAFDKGYDKSIFIAPGAVETAYKYAEFAHDFHQQGFNTFVIDHRSQGLSGRTLPYSDMIYVEDFEEYVEDFATFVNEVQREYPHVSDSEKYLLGNSLGGLICAYYLSQHSHSFVKAILAVPAMEIETFPLPESMLAFAAAMSTFWGMGSLPLPGSGYYDLRYFTANVATSSKERYGVNVKIFEEYPQTCIRSISVKWLTEFLKASSSFEEYTKIDIPVLLIQAAKDETIKADRQLRFHEEVEHCTLKIHHEGKHNLLEEQDYIRDEVLQWIQEFIA